MSQIQVPICNSCSKPHFGRKDVNQRCICDSSGNWYMGYIEEEKNDEVDILKDNIETNNDDDLRLQHEREIEKAFNRGYQSCLDDIKNKNAK